MPAKADGFPPFQPLTPPGPLQDSLLIAYTETDVLVVSGSDEVALGSTLWGPMVMGGVITAWNPFSQLLSREKNQIRSEQLRLELSAKQYPVWPTIGVPRSGQWDPEQGFAVAFPRDEGSAWLRALGRRYGQYAIFIVEDGVVRVEACFEERIEKVRPRGAAPGVGPVDTDV